MWPVGIGKEGRLPSPFLSVFCLCQGAEEKEQERERDEEEAWRERDVEYAV
jgi:hypothetical protein